VYVLVQETHQESNQDEISGPISRPDQGDPDNQAFDCPECGKSFGAQKSVEAHMLRSHRIKPSSLGGKAAKGSPSENVGEEELATAFKKEAQVANNAVLAARGKQRLRNLDPNSYKELYGIPPGQSEVGPASKLIDLEIIRQLRDMRQEEPSHQNNGDSNETAVLKREVSDLKEALRMKDLQSLRDENAKINEELKEIRSEMRSLPNSSSDLAALVKSTENIIIKAVESEGPIRRYLTPDGITIQKPSDAPKLQTQIETRSGVLEELRRHNLVTRIVDVKGGA
jgi:hypothetical protein